MKQTWGWPRELGLGRAQGNYFNGYQRVITGSR